MISNREWVANAPRTNSAHDGDSEPTMIHSNQGFNVAEAIPECCKLVMGNDHCLHKFDDIYAIDEIF